MKNIFLTILLALLIPSFSFAEGETSQHPRGKPGEGPNPFTDCGIGSTFDNKAGASSSNAIWDLGSTAITSAISSPEMCRDRKAESAKLILETLPELEKDVALGEGKYLLALTEVMGCDSAFQNEINANLRTVYAERVSDLAYGNKTDIQRATDMYNSVKVTIESLPKSCKAIL